MSESKERRTVGIKEWCEELDISEPTLRRLRKEAGFPKPLPGRRPRWARAAVEEFLAQRDAGDLAGAAFLDSGPDLAGLSAEVQHAAALRYFRQLEAEAVKLGNPKSALAWRWAIEALEVAGPTLMGSAARFLRRSNLTDEMSA